ncbi:hypothetical protein [Clostridium sp.]|uniref:hypothetical protein n=1 Tax=Clostridium sp. TaxID=1506 RepID=UPI002848B543|nr:hypothetical protein [Clostridium sp.]MDR3593994.1 hypothetical protein [Clostridium sp.]
MKNRDISGDIVNIDASGNLKLQSMDLGSYANVNIVSNVSDASAKIFASKSTQNRSFNQDFKLGVTRNDQMLLLITLMALFENYNLLLLIKDQMLHYNCRILI